MQINYSIMSSCHNTIMMNCFKLWSGKLFLIKSANIFDRKKVKFAMLELQITKQSTKLTVAQIKYDIANTMLWEKLLN